MHTKQRTRTNAWRGPELMSDFFRSLTLAIVSVFALAGSSMAQGGALANGAVSAAVSGGESSIAVSGGIGYRFNRVLGFGVELTHLPELEPGFPNGRGTV